MNAKKIKITKFNVYCCTVKKKDLPPSLVLNCTAELPGLAPPDVATATAKVYSVLGFRFGKIKVC